MFKRLLSQSLWLTIGSAIGRAAPLGFIFWCSTRFLNQEYNNISTIFMWTTVSTTLVASGISTVITQQVAKYSSPKWQITQITTYYITLLIVATLFALTCLIWGNWASSHILAKSVTPGLHVPAAVSAWAWSQVIFFTSALNGLSKARQAAVLVSLGGIAQGLGMLVAFNIYGSDSFAITWGFAIGSLVATAIGHTIISKSLNQKLYQLFSRTCFNFELVKENKYAMLLNTMASAFIMPISFIAGLLIAKSGNGPSQLAQYYYLEQINQILVYIPAIVGQVLMPSISRSLHGASIKDRADIIKSICTMIFKLLMLSSFLGIIMAYLAPYIIELIRTPQLGTDAIWAFRWMLYNAILTLPLTVLGAVMIGSGHIIFGSLSNVLWGSSVLILTFEFADFGNAGFQASRVIASLLMLLLSVSFLIFVAPRLQKLGTTS